MFKGGVTKADVQRMRGDGKERGKEKKCRKAPVRSSAVDGGNCEAAAGLMDMIKPDLMRIDGNVPSTMRAVNDMITKIGGNISLALKEAVGTSTHPPAVPIVTPTAPRNPVGGGSVEDEFYRNTIRNVMGSIKQYTMPPHHNIQVHEVGIADGR
ncbi:unnamed protein product [Brassica rapa subsp. trilocularis]